MAQEDASEVDELLESRGLSQYREHFKQNDFIDRSSISGCPKETYWAFINKIPNVSAGHQGSLGSVWDDLRPESFGITKEDVEFLKYIRLTAPFQLTVFEAFASNTSKSVSTSIVQNENENKDADKDDEKKDIKKERKIREKNRKEAKQARFGKGPEKLWCSISGKEVNAAADKALARTDEEKITCAHIIPTGCMGNLDIIKLLNDGYDAFDAFDPESPKNMLFVKGKYSVAMDSRKIGIEWTEKEGYKVFVDERFRKDYPDIHGRQLVIYDNGKLNQGKDGKSFPYRRACAWQLALVQRKVSQVFQQMVAASKTTE